MIVFLTGGTGLIGSHVAERLRARDDRVVALVRASSDTDHLRRIGCDLVVGDLLDPPETLARAMRGADAVIHAGARVFRAGSRAEYLRTNVEGTERVIEAAAVAAPRVVLLSSVAVYAGLSADRPLSEDRWLEADPERQNPYAASKHLAERAAWTRHRQGRVRLTTVRPSVVYGERDRAALPVFIRYARLPLHPLPGGGRTTLPVVYAGNVARGVVTTLDRDCAVGRAYNLGLDTPVTGRSLLTLVAGALGRRPRIVRVPAGPTRGVAAAVDGIAGVLPGVSKPDLGRAARSLTRDNPYDSARARLELGWTAHTTHDEGIRRAMAWWRGPAGHETTRSNHESTSTDERHTT